MSYNTTMGTITVGDTTYDVEGSHKGHADFETFTLSLLANGNIFDGLEGRVGYETDDTAFANPRDNSNVGFISAFYRNHELGDENIGDLDFQTDCERCDGKGVRKFVLPQGFSTAPEASRTVEVTCAKCHGNGWIEISPIAYFKKERGARVVLPLIVYEHSGITIRVGHVGSFPFDADGWDTSFVGFIYDTPERIVECFGDGEVNGPVTDKQIEEALRQEVQTYASYLEGDVTWYSVNDDETGFHESCGGYVGESDHTKEECFAMMEIAIERRLAENRERAYWAARDVVTL